jgi:antitoxin component YwqK of YwqJK toxin-antitoxin module
VAVVTHPGGAPFAVAAHFKGVLNGATMAQYDNREPMMQVTYLDGKRHGLLKSWDQTGEPQLFAQYVKGKRHGYYCVFDEHDAWMLVDYAYEVPKWIQVFSGFRLLEGYKSRELAEKNAAARKLLARADKVEESLKASEIAFRKQVSDFEQEQRKARAVQLGPAKRDQIQARANARAAQDSAFVQELYRKFYGR